MLASGNSERHLCALNLIRTVRGEVPYVRTKGIDRALIDIPESERWRYKADVEWVLDAYEPRVTFDEVDFERGTERGDVVAAVNTD